MAPFATAQELATYLGEGVSQAQGELALDIASEVVRSYCGWRIDRATETFTLDGVTGIALHLPTLCLNEVLAVTIEGAPVIDWSWNVAGVLWRPTWRAAVRGVEVQADHGYDTIPGAVRLATLQAAARAVVNPSGMRAVQAGATTETFGYSEGLTLLPHEERVLDRYRIFA